MNTTTILLIRHGETGVDPWEQVPEDPLSARGRAEVERLAAFLETWKIDAYYASPYRRATETAEILVKGKNIQVDSRLREIPLWSDPPALLEDQKRLELTKILVEAQEGVESVLENVEESYKGKTVALVCHGNIIRAILAFTLKLGLEAAVRFQLDTASMTVLEKTDAGFYRLKLFNWKPLV